jgi:hypothetical protein
MRGSTASGRFAVNSVIATLLMILTHPQVTVLVTAGSSVSGDLRHLAGGFLSTASPGPNADNTCLAINPARG